MGYTRYWKRTEKPMAVGFMDFCREVFDTCEKLGIEIHNWDGYGKPTVKEDMIAFNGDGENHLDHESLVLNNEVGFNFCKTARKPYDYAVRTILREALTRGYITDLRDDGTNEEIISDEEYVNH
jgi:hypothetical protein